MKNKLIFLTIVVVILLFIVLFFNKTVYTISVEKIDDFSPDRKLVVYKNRKKINFYEINYLDGTHLCFEENPTVSYSEIVGEKELIIKIDDNMQIVAKIVENRR